MCNSYELASVIEIGEAHDVIRGSSKLIPNVEDSPSQQWREEIMQDDE